MDSEEYDQKRKILKLNNKNLITNIENEQAQYMSLNAKHHHH